MVWTERELNDFPSLICLNVLVLLLVKMWHTYGGPVSDKFIPKEMFGHQSQAQIFSSSFCSYDLGM